MHVMPPVEVVHAFLEAINRHDVAALASLMSPDHIFTDAMGASVRGREEMRRAWVAYFFLIPDYTVDPLTVMCREQTVGVFGTARGTVSAGEALRPENHWEIPVAIRAVVWGGHVSEWQVYADNEPVRLILAAKGSV